MRTSLATRNTVEIVTGEDLSALLAQSHKTVYAGYEPSGEIHLGHLVTINKLVDLQAAGFEVIVLLADLHAFLNRKGTMEKVRNLLNITSVVSKGSDSGMSDIHSGLTSSLTGTTNYSCSSSPSRLP